MNAKLLYASLIIYGVAIAVAAVTPPAKRIYWPLYIPIAVVTVLALAFLRRR